MHSKDLPHFSLPLAACSAQQSLLFALLAIASQQLGLSVLSLFNFTVIYAEKVVM